MTSVNLYIIYGTPNRTLMLIFWYQKMISWYQKMCEFLISENHFLITEVIFCYQKMPRFCDIRNYFLISKIIFSYQKMPRFWYQKLFSDIRKWFLISENRGIFWYHKITSDIRNIRKSKFPLVFAKINRYFIMFVVLESKLGHDPVVTSSQKNVMKCTAPEYSCKPCKLDKIETGHLKFKIHLCRPLVWKNFSGKHRNNVTSLWNVDTCSDAVLTSSVFTLN